MFEHSLACFQWSIFMSGIWLWARAGGGGGGAVPQSFFFLESTTWTVSSTVRVCVWVRCESPCQPVQCGYRLSCLVNGFSAAEHLVVRHVHLFPPPPTTHPCLTDAPVHRGWNISRALSKQPGGRNADVELLRWVGSTWLNLEVKARTPLSNANTTAICQCFSWRRQPLLLKGSLCRLNVIENLGSIGLG